MFKVLIVDDDAASRTNIKTLINWEENGFEICGEASNGANAVEIIEEESPHIVITDMSMPIMDGVKLIEIIEKNYLLIKTIAISGYDDFDYVRQSLRRGAIDYILKHQLTSDILLNLLNTVKEKIVNQEKEILEKNIIQRQLLEGKSILRQNFIKQLVQGEIQKIDVIEEKIRLLKVNLDLHNIILAVGAIDNYYHLADRFSSKEIHTIISSIVDISNDILKESGKAIIVHIEESRFVLIFSLGNIRSQLQIYNYIYTSIDRIKKSVNKYLNITMTFSVSNKFNNIEEISSIYKSAVTALQNRFYKGKDIIISGNTVQSSEEEIYNINIQDEKKISHFVKALDYNNLKEYLYKIFKTIEDKRISYKSTQMVCAELINIANRLAREFGIDSKLIYKDAAVPYNELKKIETIEDAKEWILSVYTCLIEYLGNAEINSEYSEVTKRALEFIHRNFSKHISLQDAAQYVGVNSSYLSRIFKEECKKGFVEYLNSVRVEYAKELIEQGSNKIKEIANITGFSNYTYFFKVFKDIVGMTPLDYEKEKNILMN